MITREGKLWLPPQRWSPEDEPRVVESVSALQPAVARRIKMVVLHCSATKSNQRYTPEQLVTDHLRRGYDGAGYHYYITTDGLLYALRPVDKQGAHARGYNRESVGVCYEGGLDSKGEPADTRTPQQRQTLAQLVARLAELYPRVVFVGHRDLSPDLNSDGQITPEEWVKSCPCFDAKVYNNRKMKGDK